VAKILGTIKSDGYDQERGAARSQMTFKDHFSVQAADYAKFRPTYPDELFAFLARVAPAHHLAWDCATGNGQAAAALAARFDRVIATDASARQIANAKPAQGIEYRMARADESGIEAASVDLVTVAQALHWFDLNTFYAEAKRVLRPGGVLAVWGYNLLQIAPDIDTIVNRFYDEIVGPFWPPERRLIENGYEHLPFPFQELDAPRFEMTTRWSLDQLLGYLWTWSATQRFMAAKKIDPIALIASDLQAAWGPNQTERKVVWPLTLRIGRAE
jgi:SAM-dependent methyltransferase